MNTLLMVVLAVAAVGCLYDAFDPQRPLRDRVIRGFCGGATTSYLLTYTLFA